MENKNGTAFITHNSQLTTRKGFTLIELLIQLSIFAIVSSFLVGITLVATRVKNRELANAEVVGQLNSVMQTIQRMVRESTLALVKDAGGALAQTGPTLELARSGATTTVTLANNIVKLTEGVNPQNDLTSANVTVDELTFTRYLNSPGPDTVSILITMHYTSGPLSATSTKTLRSSASVLQPAADY